MPRVSIITLGLSATPKGCTHGQSQSHALIGSIRRELSLLWLIPQFLLRRRKSSMDSHGIGRIKICWTVFDQHLRRMENLRRVYDGGSAQMRILLATSRTELEIMVAENALFSAAVLSRSDLAKLLLSVADSEDAIRRISSM
jgi:hypothetical protein